MSSLDKIQYDTLIASMRELERKLDSMEADLTRDRQDIQDTKIGLKTLEGEMQQLRQSVNSMADRVKDKVAGVVVPAMEGVADDIDKFKKAVEKKKFIAFKRPGFLSRLFGRGGDKE